jgi:putative ABC transport system permease protein
MANTLVNTVKKHQRRLHEKRTEVVKTLKAKDSVIWLSWADLRHEWILTLCLIAAIAAVLSPLLILFGLKYGLVNIYLTSLIQDPLKREIRPLSSRSYSQAWFEQISRREEVAFVIPNTRQLSATIIARVKDRKEKQELEMIPTAQGDPLLIENGAVIPGAGECVLTQFAAEALQANAGDTLLATASRVINGKYEYGSLELKVGGILPLRASSRELIYVQLDILEAVERFKDGRAVPEYEWPGELPTAYPQYNGLVVVTPQRLDEITKRSLAVGTGFTQFEEPDTTQLQAKVGFQVAPEMGIYLVSTAKKPVGQQSIKNVRSKLRGKEAVLLPYIEPVPAQLSGQGQTESEKIMLYALSVDAEDAEKIGLDVVPEWGASQAATADMLKIMLPADRGGDASESLSLTIAKDEENALTFPVAPVPQHSPLDKAAFIPAELAGIVKLYADRDLSYDAQQQEFVLARRGYASFRLYADSIYAVEGLRRFFEEQGLSVHSAAREIEEVVQRAKYVDITFWLIAMVGISGTIAALVASLYASVERKKRELGVLRLIGLSGPSLFRFPIYQGILIGVGGFITSVAVFQVFSWLINQLFTSHVEKLLGFSLSLLKTSQNLCWIPASYLTIALAGTMLVSGCAALVAAVRVNRIEAAEALRDE